MAELRKDQYETSIGKYSGYASKQYAYGVMAKEMIWAEKNSLNCAFSVRNILGRYVIILTHKTDNWECNCHIKP